MSISRSEAVGYLSARLDTEDFTEASEDRQSQALRSAEDAISGYKSRLSGSAYFAAVCLQAVWLLGSRAKMQTDGVSSFSLSGISESYNVSKRPANIAPDAWRVITDDINGGNAAAGVGGLSWQG